MGGGGCSGASATATGAKCKDQQGATKTKENVLHLTALPERIQGHYLLSNRPISLTYECNFDDRGEFDVHTVTSIRIFDVHTVTSIKNPDFFYFRAANQAIRLRHRVAVFSMSAPGR